MMHSKDFVQRIKNATTFKTLYVTGCFGWPMTEKNKARIIKAYPTKNGVGKRYENIMASDQNTFGFDCVNLIKAILWGWYGDSTKEYGGCIYQSNGVPDETVEAMFGKCTKVSSEFNDLTPGEAVWMPGHIGIYVGDGLSVECTPKWTNNVQYTACNHPKSGYNTRYWQKHGFLPYVDYSDIIDPTTIPVTSPDTVTDPPTIPPTDPQTVPSTDPSTIPPKTYKYAIVLTTPVQKGDSGEAVKQLQKRICQLAPEFEDDIRMHSFTKDGDVDGIFGSGMVKLMKWVQACAGLPTTGKLDNETMEVLNRCQLEYEVDIRAIKDIVKNY